jgi:uncharacterized membrane protein
MGIEQTIYTSTQTLPKDRQLTLRTGSDLLLLVVLALLPPVLLLLPPSLALLRVPLGLAMVLLAPGTALAAALFPKRDDIDTPTRAGLNFGLSIAVIPLLALLLDGLPWGIRPWPIAIGLSIWMWLCCGVAALRRWLLIRSGLAYAPPSVDLAGWWQRLDRGIRVRYIAGALALGAALSAGAMPLILADSSPHMTEFYILGKQGLAEDYPRLAAPGEALTVTMGVANKERGARTYRVEIWAADPWNAGRRALVAQEGPIILRADEQREWPVTWQLPWAGNDQQVEFLLFSDDSPEPYRRLRLWLNVVEQ